MAPGTAKNKAVGKTSRAKKKTPAKTTQQEPVSLTVDQMMQIMDETLTVIKDHDPDMQVTEIVEELDNKGRYKIKRKLEKKNLEAIKDIVFVDEDEIEKMLLEAENEPDK